MATEATLTDDYRKRLLHFILPLVPVWLAGAFILAFSSEVWTPVDQVGLDGQLQSITDGWVLIGALIAGTFCYLFAPQLGSKLAVVTNSYGELPSGMPTHGQSMFGTGVIRLLSMLFLYVCVASYVVMAWRGEF